MKLFFNILISLAIILALLSLVLLGISYSTAFRLEESVAAFTQADIAFSGREVKIGRIDYDQLTFLTGGNGRLRFEDCSIRFNPFTMGLDTDFVFHIKGVSSNEIDIASLDVCRLFDLSALAGSNGYIFDYIKGKVAYRQDSIRLNNLQAKGEKLRLNGGISYFPGECSIEGKIDIDYSKDILMVSNNIDPAGLVGKILSVPGKDVHNLSVEISGPVTKPKIKIRGDLLRVEINK